MPRLSVSWMLLKRASLINNKPLRSSVSWFAVFRVIYLTYVSAGRRVQGILELA